MKARTMTPAGRCLFTSALFGLLLTSAPLICQSNLEWYGEFGLRYFSRNPFISGPASWRYAQGIAGLGLSGFIWDPRFLQFDLGGNFNYTGYGGSTGSPDNRYWGYWIESRFLPKSKFSFGLRFLKNDMGTTGKTPDTSSLRYAVQEKGFDLSLSRVKYLPSIRLAYADRAYQSFFSDSQMNENDNRLNLDINQPAGISTFDLNYRRENYRNQVVERDRSHENLRATERLRLKGGTTIWFEGILTKNTLALPDGGNFESSYSQISGNTLTRLSERLNGNVRYAYVDNSVDGQAFSLHQAQASANYLIRPDLILSPLVAYSRSGIETPAGGDVVKESQAGARLTWDNNWKILSWRTHIELVFRIQDSREQGKVKDWNQAFGANLSLGSARSLLGSLSYSYSGAATEINIPEYGDPLYYYGIGTNLNRHLLRLELRSQALRPLDTYLYSRYDSYDRELYGQGPMDATTSNNGLRVGLGRLSLAADIGTDELVTGEMTARYRTLTSTLDFIFSSSFDFRAQYIESRRQDLLTGRDFHRGISLFLNYSFGRFMASLIYQNVAWELDGPLKQDEVFSVTMTRSFGTRR